MGGRPLREAPAEFAIKAVEMTWDEARKHWACGAATLTRWMSETGAKLRVINPELRGHKLRPMPNDFRRYGHVESLKALCARYTTGPDVVRRWREEVGAKPLPMNKMRPMPDDFREMAATLHREKLAVLYQCGQPVLSRWFAESGVTPKEYKNPDLGKFWHGRATGLVPVTPQPQRDATVAGEAADFLRRKGWVVFRARIIRTEAPKDDWIVGRLTLPTSEMVAQAERGGFVRRDMM